MTVNNQTVNPSQSIHVVTSTMGTTTIKGTPKRVVALTNEATDTILALGVKPIGAVKSWTGEPYYDYIQEQMKGVTIVGEERKPNLELVASLQPDLIIGSKIRQEKVYEKLSAIAPTVFSETIGLTWKDNLILYAKALNKIWSAEKIIIDWEQRVADFKAKMETKLSQQVSLVRFLPKVVRIYYKNCFAGRILEEVGFQRPKTQDKEEFASTVAFESIPEIDGDILFYFTFERGKGEATKMENLWLNHPLWRNLNVVKNHKVYQVSDVFWNTAGGVQAANKMLDDLSTYLLNK